MMKLPFINRIFPSYRSKIIAVIIGGIIVGGGALFMYMLRAHTYLGDDPAACVNCHIMSPYYATWFHSSHARDATCNDCHVPHENIVKKWTFKGMDGMKHVAAFLTKSEPQVIEAHEEIKIMARMAVVRRFNGRCFCFRIMCFCVDGEEGGSRQYL